MENCKCNCSNKSMTTKEEILKLMDAHMQTSLDIRKALAAYIRLVCSKEEADSLCEYIKTCNFADVHAIAKQLPECKAACELTKGEFFINPDGGEKLQAWNVKPNEDGTVTIKALHYDNELSKYLFDAERMVAISK